MADLRDDKVVRASYLSQLIDLDGSDLKKVYEPISNQIGYLITIGLFLMVCHFAWKRYRRWRNEGTSKLTPYKVLKPPSTMIEEQSSGAGPKKRVCAVVGGTGFVGSHTVDELVRRGDCYVFSLGRRFRPERTNPDVDCQIQVDMQDYDGLVNAFQGVHSVINAAAIIPNVFHTAEGIYSVNNSAFGNILKACKDAGVKSLVHISGFPPKNKLKDPTFAAFMNLLTATEKNFVAANGEDGLQTCVIAPTNIVGINSPFFDKLLSGEMKSCVMYDDPSSFVPMDYLVKAIANAEERLATQETSASVAGKVLYLHGEIMSWRAFFNQPGWPHKISEVSPFVFKALVKTNVLCASLFGWAPFTADLSAGILEVLKFVEADMPEEELQEVYKVLGVGPPHPPIADYIPQMLEKYKAKHANAEGKKNQ